MTSAQAILTGALIIAGSILFINSIRPAEAQRVTSGPYQLMHHSNTVANAGVFRLDTSSGEVTYCFIAASQDLTCTKSVK
jgi:hypothetical protein